MLQIYWHHRETIDDKKWRKETLSPQISFACSWSNHWWPLAIFSNHEQGMVVNNHHLIIRGSQLLREFKELPSTAERAAISCWVKCHSFSYTGNAGALITAVVWGNCMWKVHCQFPCEKNYVMNAYKLFGSDLARMRGETVQQSPTQIQPEYVEVLWEIIAIMRWLLWE